MLDLAKVGKTFGGLKAVSDVTLSVKPGEIYGLIGPNGAGKTTIFNVATGVYRPDEGGAVRLAGREIHHLAPFQIAALGVARTFQNIRIFGEMSVVENVLVSAHMSSKVGLLHTVLRTGKLLREEKERMEKALELLEIFNLSAVWREHARNLPYGSQRRLEIARALMMGPKLLLLDEPAAGMNTAEALALNEQIRWLRDRFQLTIVLVEHNMKVVMGVCERIHVVDHGVTIAEGTPAEIQKDPHVIAAYLGEDIDGDA